MSQIDDFLNNPLPPPKAEGAAGAKPPSDEITAFLSKRTTGEAVKDTGLGLAQGVAGLVKSAGDAYGLATVDMDNAVSKTAGGWQEDLDKQKSVGFQTRAQRRKANIDAEDSTLGKAWTAVKDTVTDPALAIDTVATNAATLIPGAAAGRVVAGARMAQAARAGLAGEAAATAAVQAGKAGTAAAIGTGAAQQATDVSAQAYEDNIKKSDAVWDANPDFQAAVAANGGDRTKAKHELSLAAARAAFVPAAGVSVAANAIPGGAMLEKALVGGAAREVAKEGAKLAIPKAIAKGALGEATGEAIEEGGGQFAANVAAQRYIDPNQDLTEGVGENAGLGAAGGLLMGGAGGAFHGRQPAAGSPEAQQRALDQASTAADAALQQNPVVPNWETELGATNPNARPAQPGASSLNDPTKGVDDWTTDPGAAAPYDNGIDFTRDIDTQGLALADAPAAGAEMGQTAAPAEIPQQTPAEAMGIDKDAGTLSNAAALAVNSGASNEIKRAFAPEQRAPDAAKNGAKEQAADTAQPSTDPWGNSHDDARLPTLEGREFTARMGQLNRELAIAMDSRDRKKAAEASDAKRELFNGSRSTADLMADYNAAAATTDPVAVHERRGIVAELGKRGMVLDRQVNEQTGEVRYNAIKAREASKSTPGVYSTYEDARKARVEQNARGTSIQTIPSPVDGGFILAVKGSPEYKLGEQYAEQRRKADSAANRKKLAENQAKFKQAAELAKKVKAEREAGEKNSTPAQEQQAQSAINTEANTGDAPNVTETDQAQQASTQFPAPNSNGGVVAGQDAGEIQGDEGSQRAGPGSRGGDAEADPAGNSPDEKVLTDGSTTPENPGAQAAPAPGPQTQTEGAGRAQHIADAGAAWTRMPAAERQAVAAKLDGVKPVFAKNLPRAPWANLNSDIQRKIADAIAPQNPGAVATQVREENAKGTSINAEKNASKDEAKEDAAPAPDKAGNTIVGRRADGVLVRQDQNGLRWYTKDGVRISETVELRPTREGIRLARGELKPEFMTAAESEAAKPAQAPATAPAPKEATWSSDEEKSLLAIIGRNGGVVTKDMGGHFFAEVAVSNNDTKGVRATGKTSLAAKRALLAKLQEGQHDELDGEMRGYEAKSDSAVQEPAKAPALAEAKKPSADQTRAKADLMNALADLGDILGKNTRMNMVSEQEQKLLPVLTRVLDAAFRLGYHKFKDSAKFSLDQIREHLGADAANALTLDHLQGAYIAMAGGKQGVDTKRAVIDVEDKAEIEAHQALTVEAQAATMEKAPAGADQNGDQANERPDLRSDGPQALGPVATAEGGRVESQRGAGASPADSRESNPAGSAGSDVAGLPAARSGGSGPAAVRPAQARGSRQPGAVGAKGNRSPRARVPEVDGRVAVPGGEASAPNIPASDFQITDDVGLGKGGEVQKFNDNLAAIRALKHIEAEGRRASPDEQALLARYVGWGGLANAFPDPISGNFKDKWQERGDSLRDLLTKEEYAAARRSTRNAHYTSQTVVSAMWDMVRRLGYRGGLVLESSLGTGNFLGLAPKDMPNKFVGVEYDSLTARMGQALYPQATVLHSGFQKVPVADNAFMLNIGNPPFGSESLRFQFKPELQGVSIHNQFFRAGMDALRPGGLQAMVVSRFLMDAQDKSTRLALAQQAKLVAAFRLPDTAFKENARTEVVTDILIFQKLEPAEQAAMETAVAEYRKLAAKKKDADAGAAAMVPAWVDTVQVPDPLGGEAMTVNAYFQANAQNVLGVMERSGSMQRGAADINVRLDNPADLATMLREATARLPENIHSVDQQVMDATAARHKSMSDALRIAVANEEAGHVKRTPEGLQRVIERETPEGDYEFAYQPVNENSPWNEALNQDANGKWYVLEQATDADGKKLKVLGQDGTPTRRNLYERKMFDTPADVPESMRLGKLGLQRLEGLVGLRDLLKRQLVLETADAAKAVMEGNRKALAKAYAEFVKANGPINRSTNMKLAMTMPDGGLVAALEVGYQPARTADQAAKSGLPAQKEQATAAPILRERVVPKYEPATKAESASDALAITLAERGRVDLERIAALLGTTETEAAEKLQQGAEPLVFQDPETQSWETADAYLSGMVKRKLNAARAAGLTKNVQALEKVIPADWTAENVSATLGGTWVPADVYGDFVQHLAGGKARVSFSPLTNSFNVSLDSSDRAAVANWSTEGAPVDYIVSRILNSKAVTVTGRDEDGNTFIDKEKTALAGLKAREIEAEFGDWVFKDGDRRQRLVDIFNEKFNTRVVRQFNGQHLQLPGKVPDAIIKMRRHQMNAIWRGIYERNMLVDHAVGAGKTFTAIARAMERRRMGLSRKPMIVVPNHLVEQWESDVYRLYPGAKVLAAGKKDFEAKRRRRLFGKIATGDWDIVIVPHSSFGFIGIAPETESRYLEQEMAQAQAAIEDAWAQAREDGQDTGRRKPFNVKEAERLAEKIQGRMDRLAEGVRDRLLTFEQLGVDDMSVDEAHEFKNLYYSSNLTGVRGMGDKTGSRKANDLYNKVRVLREQPTGSVTFLTGTPISNSAVEMFTMLRYLAADSLQEMGLTHFDAFRAQFVEATPAFEPTESGRLKQVTRLGRTWSNMRSLMDLYYQVTDAVSLEDIKRFYAEDNPGREFPVPKIAGGKDRELVAIKPTPAQESALKEVMADFDSLEDIKDPYERNAERLRLMDRARKLSLDIRAVDSRSASKEEGGKLQVVSENIKRIYDKWTPDLGTQLVFLDRSVPKAKGDDKILKEYDDLLAKRSEALRVDNQEDFDEAQEALDRYDSNEIAELRLAQSSPWSAYQQIKDNLIAQGIPANEIRFVQEANNDEQKAALFDAVNGGKVRVLIGSTPRMGAGTNVQQRAVALHHVDVTWKPSDIEQREGRVIRQGNQLLEKYGDAFEVELLAYATERTVDAKMWDLNATKLRTINGIRKYDGAFSMEFEDEEAVGMAEMAALASGNPMLLERVKVESEIQTLELQERAHRRKMWGVEDELRFAREAIERNPGRIEAAEQRRARSADAFETLLDEQAQRSVTVEGQSFGSVKEAFAAAEEIIKGQQAGNDKARYALTIDGKRVTTKEGISDAITSALGDVDPFAATVGGKTFTQRTAAAREAAEVMNKAMKGQTELQNLPLGQMLGFELVGDMVPMKMKDGATVYEPSLTLMDGDRTVASHSGNVQDGELAANNLRGLLQSLVNDVHRNATSNEADYLRQQLARAERDLSGLEARKGEGFPKAQDLAEKRKRLAELVSQLEGKTVAEPTTEAQAEAGDETADYSGQQARRPGTAQDKAVMQAIADGKNARDVLRLIASQSKSKFNSQVAGMLLKSGITPKLVFGHIGKTAKGTPIHGQYRGNSDTIAIARSAEYAAERIFLHEAMHAATMRGIRKPGLASLQMNKLLAHIQKQKGAAGFYGTENVDEFVAEVFTNPDFQNALRQMSAPAGSSIKSAWDSFVRILRAILGLPNDSTNALSQALEMGVALMREDMTVRKQAARQAKAMEKRIKPVSLQLRGWDGSRAQLRALASTWYSENLQGKAFANDDMGVDVLFSSEGKGVAFNTSGNLRVGWRAEMVKALPELVKRAVKVSEQAPDARRTEDSRAFHTLVAPLEVNGKTLAAKITLREALKGPDPKHKFYDIAALEIKDGAVLSGLKGSDQDQNPLPTGTTPSGVSVADLARAINQKEAEGETLNFGTDDLSRFKASAIDQITQSLSYPGKVSIWDKTVGTMRNLGERVPQFKPVFESAQRFIDDVSMLANDAADFAPRLMPRVENWSDLKKKPVTAADNKAVAKPLFEGTLLWARDLDGTAVTTEALNAKYAKATADEKAQIMLRTGQITDQMLKTWRGHQLDRYETIINNKFESTILKPGVVWSEKELKTLFGMNDVQVSLYQEARAAIDRSIDVTARTDMMRLMGEDYAPMREAVLGQPTLQDAFDLVVETLQADARENPDKADRLLQINNAVVNRFGTANDLTEHGYAPLSRFGKYTVDVVDTAGERQYFGMFESKREANQMAQQMRDLYKDATVTQGTMSEQAFKLFQGITPESLEQFGEMLGLKAGGQDPKDKAFQAYLQLAKNNHSALKRLIHRKGIDGYSEDVGRVLASFVYSNARLGSGGLNAGTMEKAINGIPKEMGELNDVAMGLRSYIQDPQEEGQAVRGMLFAQYLGGSVASAMVNMTQPFQITMPWLSQFGGMKKAAGQMARALKDMSTKGFKYEADLAKALRDAEDDGTVSPQEIHQLMAQARGTGSLRSGDGTRLGDARAAASNNWERLKVVWGQPFALAEQFNRRSTFIAAYRTAKEQGMADPSQFARDAVLETQFLYSKANKPKWARGAIGGTLFTFKTYSVSYLELMHRMWTQGGTEGRRAVGWSVAMLLLMAGAGGLPFMEDLEDLIDGAGQMMGYNISAKQWRKELLQKAVGKEVADFMEQGLSGLPGAPIDISGRLGLGNLIPGTGLFLTKQGRERDLLEIVGPAGDLISRGFTGARKALTGDVGGAAMEFAPNAVRNAAKGLDMATSGIYKDAKGYKVIDTTLAEAASKFIGFQPKSVAEVQESNSFMQRSKSFYTQTSSDIKAQWAQAIFNKDDAALQRVRERLEAWNRNNPDQPIVVKIPDVMKRVREMGKDRTHRIADTAPKALRQQMREMAKEASR